MLTEIEYYQSGIKQYTQTLTYDEIGNLKRISDSRTSYLDWMYTWQGRELMTISTYMKGYTFKYNDQGVRSYKKQSGTSTIESTYYLNGYQVLVETINNEKIYYTYTLEGSLFSMNYQGVEYFYVTNLQGDIIEIIDTLGNAVAKYRYDAWGNIIYQYDDGSNIDDINPYRYRSYRYDKETNLYYLQSRYYDPRIGRFINADSVSYLEPMSDSGLNLFAYCGNNPVMYLNGAGYNSVSTNNSVGVTGAVLGTNGSSSSDWNTSWWNWKGSWYNGTGSIYEASYGDFSFSAGMAKIALLNFTQKNFRIINAQIDLVRAEYNVNDYALIHATLGTGKAFIAFNSQDGFGAEAKLVILTVGAKSGPIGINFDIGAVGFTAKYVNGKLEIGASAVVGFTISINVFEAYEWIKEQGGTRYVLIN